MVTMGVRHTRKTLKDQMPSPSAQIPCLTKAREKVGIRTDSKCQTIAWSELGGGVNSGLNTD